MVNIIIPFKRTFGSTYNSWSTFLQVVTEKWLLFIIIRKIFVVTTINVHGARHLTFFGITYKSLHFNCIFSAKYRSKNVIWLLIKYSKVLLDRLLQNQIPFHSMTYVSLTSVNQFILTTSWALFVQKGQTYLLHTLDILFRQITTLIKVHVACVFGCQNPLFNRF